MPTVDSGDGTASELSAEERMMDMKARTMSDPDSNPITGAGHRRQLVRRFLQQVDNRPV
jgi:hypothetical protein